MILTGIKKDGKKPLILQEVLLECNISELDKIITFLTKTRNDFVQAPNYSYDDVLSAGEDTIAPHRHINLEEKMWDIKNPDIIVSVPFKARKREDGQIIWEDMELSVS